MEMKSYVGREEEIRTKLKPQEWRWFKEKKITFLQIVVHFTGKPRAWYSLFQPLCRESAGPLLPSQMEDLSFRDCFILGTELELGVGERGRELWREEPYSFSSPAHLGPFSILSPEHHLQQTFIK